MRCIKTYIILVLLLSCSLSVSAREVYNLNRDWKFFTNNDLSSDASAQVNLPHTWNNDALSGKSDYFRGVGNYLKKIDIPENWKGKRIFLRLYGSNAVTYVMANGRLAGVHAGGNSAFTVELTDLLHYGKENNLWVLVNNSPRLDVLPTGGEQNFYGGIYRNVELIVTNPFSVSPLWEGGDGVSIRPDKISDERVEGKVLLRLLPAQSVPENARVSVRFYDNNSQLVAQTSRIVTSLNPDSSTITLPFAISKPALWNGLEAPNLYNTEVKLTLADSLTSDSIVIRTGFRTVSIDPQQGFLLNGRPYPIRGVVVHRDRLMVGPAVSPFQIEEDLNIIREMGATAVRVAGGQHSDYFYSLCDEFGILVWNDSPLQGAAYFTDNDYIHTDHFRDNGRQQLSEMICQLENHPSVVMWGIFSDLSCRGDDPIPYVRELDSLARALDPSRMTVASSNQDGDINFITNLIVFNQSLGWRQGMPSDIKIWSEQIHKNWPQLRVGVSYSAGGSIYQQDEELVRPKILSNWHPEGWQTYFHEEYLKSLQSDSLFWGIFVGNMFDFGSAANHWGDDKGTNDHGLVTFDRKDRKDAYYLYKANWNRSEPFVYITEKRNDSRTNRRQTIRVYSNQEEVELFVNNRSEGSQKGENGIFIWKDVNMRGGINRLEARSGYATDQTSINIDAGSASQRREALHNRQDQ